MKKLVALLLCLMMVVPATLASAETAEGKVLNIWCWNDEFQSRFNAYYPEVKEIAEDKSTTTLNDGTIVKWTINPNEGNNYQNKLDEALRAQESAAADDKIDIFLIEADYALKYVDSPYTLDVKADIGLTDEDLAGQYKYTQEIATSADDKLKAVTWQATPGLFAYRRSIAKDVLGTEDPDAVQEALADWDKFNAVAEQAAAKGYYMLSGYDDAYRTFSNNVSAPWVADDGETVVVDANLMKWVDQTKLYTEKGYNHKSSLWDATWAADQGPTGKVFGFFYSTWGINGTWICAAAGTDNVATIKDVMQKLTCDAAIAKKITEDTQDYTNNVAAMNELAQNYSSAFLGGQNHIALFAEAAPKIDMSNISAYDQGLNESFQGAFKNYFDGNATIDEAKAQFESIISEKYSELVNFQWPDAE